MPKLEECFKVLKAWGFEYKTGAVWDKVNIGMGYYWRSRHELLLLCTKGSVPTPKNELKVPSVHSEKRGKHSKKPEYYAELLESWYPELSKVELFCRTPRAGWDVWGNQSG
jgi:N6-adenosine-specific RNA methylase IME4